MPHSAFSLGQKEDKTEGWTKWRTQNKNKTEGKQKEKVVLQRKVSEFLGFNSATYYESSSV